MVNWNPNFPEVLGLEWLMTRGIHTRVWAGGPARAQRLVSTTAETVSALKMSARVNALLSAGVPTVIDVIEEGSEYVALPKLKRMTPTVDRVNGGWTRSDGSATSLYTYIDDPTTKWPNPNSTAETQHIRTFTAGTEYTCAVDTSIFQGAGAAANGRVFWLAANAILAANTGFRKLSVKLLIDGQVYDPAGGATRDVHGFGAIYTFWWGEINPATGKPWTPSEIARFGTEADWGLRVRSGVQATSSHYPKVHALSLDAYYSETENRKAVGVWNRPEDMSAHLLNVTTDSLITLPAGTANWSKASGKNYLFYWRQSVSPALYGPIVADDVRWMGQYQALPTNAQPPGINRPLYNPNASEATHLAADEIVHDHFGRPQAAFDSDKSHLSKSSSGLALTVLPVSGSPTPSVDSQPYRLDLADLAFLHSGQTLGQKVTPVSTQSYVGVRVPIIPPQAGPTGSTLTIGVYAVSGGAQVGGSFTITEAAVRKLPSTQDGIRYVSGVLSAAAALTGGTAYEIRLSSTAPSDKPWIAFMPDSSLAPEVSFGGTTNGAYIGASHQTSRDLVVNLLRQPDAPTAVTAVATNVPVTMPDGTTRDVDHALVTWTAPATPLVSLFARYEVERQVAGETTWTRVINIPNDGLTEYVDHLVRRSVPATYRVRQVATDGRFSAWATASPLTIEPGDYSVILTSNHRPDLEVLLDVDLESTYEFLSTATDETVPIHGSDYQVVFMQTEDRGTRWQFNAEVNYDNAPQVGRTGDRVFDSLNALVRAEDVPYVAMMDFQGTRVLGHVTPSGGKQKQPGNVYSTTLDVIPTHGTEEAIDGPMIAYRGKSISDQFVSTSTGGYLSTPDHTSLQPSGVLDARWEITLPSATFATDQGLAAKWQAVSTRRSWAARFTTSGMLQLFHSPDGVTSTSTTSGAAIAQAGRAAYRMVFVPDNGTGSRELRCYRSYSIDAPVWTLVDTATGAAVAPLWASSIAALTVGSQDTAIPIQNASLHAFELRNGENGPVVSRWDADNLAVSTATTLTDDTGKLWTLQAASTFGSALDTAPIPGGARSGDLLVAFAYRETSTAPSLPANWVNVYSGGSDGNSARVAYRFWDGTFTGPAWTNAQGVIMLAYRGVDPTTPIGAATGATGSAIDVVVPSAGTFQVTDRTSWGLALYGSAAGGALSPAFGTERVDFPVSTARQLGAADSNGGRGEWLGGLVPQGYSVATGYAAVALELRAKP